MGMLPLTLLGCTVVLLPTLASAVAQTPEQQRCVVKLLGGGLDVATAQSRANAACVRDAGTGAVSDLPACLTADGDGSLAEAVASTAADTLASCAEFPADFAVPNAFEQTVSEASIVHERGVVTDLFGPDPGGAIIAETEDAMGAKCQAQVAKRTEALMIVRQKAFVGCVKKLLRKGATEARGLTGCVESNLRGTVSRASRASVAWDSW